MPLETLVIAPKSAGISIFSVSDDDNNPIDFEVGTWKASMQISAYPNAPGDPLFDWTTENGRISFDSGEIVLSWDETISYDFTRAHYDLYITGPNISSKAIRVNHGPVRIEY
jgi:hypothetical protein